MPGAERIKNRVSSFLLFVLLSVFFFYLSFFFSLIMTNGKKEMTPSEEAGILAVVEGEEENEVFALVEEAQL